MMEWISGADVISDGEYKTLFPGYIDLTKKDTDIYQLSFVSDINNQVIVNLNKKECEELSDKLKDIIK
jgi:hypothetical protein